MNSNDEEQKQVTRSVLSYTFERSYENATSIHAICNRENMAKFAHEIGTNC